MKKMCIIGFIFLFLAACGQSKQPLDALQNEADQQAEQILALVANGQVDSIRQFVHQDGDIVHIIFNDHEALFWSSNSLNIGRLPQVVFDEWHTCEFDNASAIVKWYRMGQYKLMTVIPTEWHIQGLDEIEHSFSYQSVREAQQRTSLWQTLQFRVHVYFAILLVVCVVCIGIAIGMLVAAGGFRNLHLRRKIQLVLSSVVLFIFLYLGISIMRFERTHHEEQQREQLQNKCKYVQAALQQIYYSQMRLTPREAPVLNIDLRNLGRTYEADIHVYNVRGRLAGSSTPSLFEQGLLNQIMDPEVFFSKQPTQIRYEQIGQVRYLVAFTEFVNGVNIPIGYIAIPFFISEEDVAHEVDSVMARLLPPFIVMLVLTLVVSYLIAQAITRPIQGLIDKMKHFALGQDNHIVYHYNDELGELVKRYNLLADELEQTTRRVIHSEREGAWRTMARQIAHEINNPLTPMKLTVQQLQRLRGTEAFEQKFVEASQMLVEQINTLSRIATSFSTFAKLPQVVTSEVDIAQKLSQAIVLQQTNSEQIPIRYVGADSGVMAYADREQIGQVFTNILKNALQALEGRVDGDIIVMLKKRDSEVEISFSDNGPGIPQELQSKVFMPNFTTKSTGTGLGLAISKNIVEGSDGRITFTSSDKGTTFYIYLKCLEHSN
ncbi:MAG: ATP-binding protein [Paludibacteraceae bacterium]|nr:ATP-binding protein [Paludibacteraceae bacterium]